MDFALFDFLEGLSPWWWVAAGVIIGALEMATMSFFLIWPALAAFVMAVVLWLNPGMSGEAQVLSFAIVAIAVTLAGRSLMHRFGDGGGRESDLNQRSAAMVGRSAKVLERDGREGAVEIDGIRWRAVWPDSDSVTPTHVMITAADGMTLKVDG